MEIISGIDFRKVQFFFCFNVNITQEGHLDVLFFRLYKSEDVTVGTWLAPLNVYRMHDPRFDTGTFTRGCQDDAIAIHDKSPEELRVYHRRLLDGLGPCPEVKLKVQPYLYNWSVLPSQCCSLRS